MEWDIGCLIGARPTRSEMLFVQVTGRGLRTAEGKENLLVLDHADNSIRLGFVTEIHHDKLDDGAMRPAKAKRKKNREPKECPSCKFLRYPSTRKCPHCGFEPVPMSGVGFIDGELTEIQSKKAVGFSHEQKAVLFGQFKFLAREKGHKPGWAAHLFKDRFGEWPNGCKDAPETEPTPAVRSWVKSRMIRFARAPKEDKGNATA